MNLLQIFAHDLRIGLRSLLRAPALTLTIVLTVGIGIGGTTAIFAGVQAAIIRPLPYADAGRLVRIFTDSPPNRFRLSVADYLAIDQQQTQFEGVAAYTDVEVTFTDGAVAERIRGKNVSPAYFSLLGVTPALGRSFTAAEGRAGGERAVVVSHAFWTQRLGGRRDALGTTVRLDGNDYPVVGVLASAVGPLEQGREVFVATQWTTPPRKGPFFLIVLGRLPRAAAWPAAQEELRTNNTRIFPLWRSSYQDERATWGMVDLKEAVLGDVRTIAGLAVGAVALVWIIACVNASNLLLGRVMARRRELAVRTALGASRGRIVRYLLAESTLLSLGAAVVGISLAWGGTGLLRTAGAAYLPRTQEIALDGPVLWLLAAVTAASVLLFGLLPALNGTGAPMDESLRAGSRSSTATLAVRRLRRVLVGGQFAVATPLLIVAGLLAVSLNELRRVDLGFDPNGILTGAILLPAAQYKEPARVTAFWDELQRRLESLPAVARVAFTDSRPPNDANNYNNFQLEDAPTLPGGSQPVTAWVSVTPGYFGLFGLSLVDGRFLDERDGPGQPAVVVVDRAWAARFFPNQRVVGRRLRSGGCSTCDWTTIVGVVGDVKYDGLEKANGGTVYWPIATRGDHPVETTSSRFRYVVLRSDGDAAALVPAVRDVVRDLDRSLPFSRVATIDDLVATSLQMPRSLTMLIGVFAAVALLLSVVGVYGVMAHYVLQHRKDISIRLALGGRPVDVLRVTVGQGMRSVVAGVAAGLLIALLATRVMSALLFGVGALDATTFAAAASLLLAIALVACLVPAVRALAVEPAAVLRDE